MSEALTEDQELKLEKALMLIADVQIERLKQFENKDDEEWRALYRIRAELGLWVSARNAYSKRGCIY